jgi:hypothetical protein
MADSFLRGLYRKFINGKPVFALNNAKMGYQTGGTVTQLTSKVTAFTLDQPTGQIVLNNSALAAWTNSSATWTNSFIGSFDIICANQTSGTIGAYEISFVCSNGQAQVVIYNTSSTSLSEAVAFTFYILGGSQS